MPMYAYVYLMIIHNAVYAHNIQGDFNSNKKKIRIITRKTIEVFKTIILIFRLNLIVEAKNPIVDFFLAFYFD